ncbi:Orm1 type endoplasmic reticulum protein [Atractiella rhizophila]|nr:Orm1 type endoplasmic reticulum protein [Atractiella rhizophila]
MTRPSSSSISRLNSPHLLEVPLQDSTRNRGRSSSLLSVKEIQDNDDGFVDEGAMSNYNADWVNYKGAWILHLLLLALAKLILDSLPFLSQNLSWTILNIGYNLVTYIIFHHTLGVPLESQTSNYSGVYDRLTLWEQIDEGDQYTPSKKWLSILPIALMLCASHYIKEDSGTLFALNFIALLVLGLIPKLPVVHRMRLRWEGFGGTKERPIGFEMSGPPVRLLHAFLPCLLWIPFV